MPPRRALLERDAELELLTRLLGDVDTDGGKVVLVRGEAGIGKTALIREFIDRVEDRAHILFGSCDDLLTPRPLGPFWDMGREEQALRKALETEDRSLVMETALSLLSRGIRPTVMVIEDTQWADEATLDTIGFLGRRIETANGLLLITFRDTGLDLEHPLRSVLGALPPRCVTRIRLEGLSLPAVASLIGVSKLDASDVMAMTDGNPFLVTEMASAEDSVPSSVRDSVMARVGKLSEPARDLLRIMSVIPERTSRQELLRLEPCAGPGLEECERAGLLDFDGGMAGFHHELTRMAVENSLTESERVSMNRLVLESLPPETDPARLVHHARGAHDVERLIAEAPRAARAAAAVGSLHEAVDHFRQLLPHVDRLPLSEKGRVLEDWAWAAVRAEGEAAALPNRLALEHYRMCDDLAGQSRALAREALLAEWRGQRGEAEQHAREAISVLGPYPRGLDLVEALEVNAWLAMMAGDTAGTIDLVDQTFAAAGGKGDERILIRCLVHKGTAVDMARYPEGKAILDEAHRRAVEVRDWREASRALVDHAEVAIYFRDLNTAVAYAQEAYELVDSHEWVGPLGYEKSLLAMVFELTGDWDRAEELAREAIRPSAAHGLNDLTALPRLGSIEARTGRASGGATLRHAWDLAATNGEITWMSAAASALAEYTWITEGADLPISELEGALKKLIDIGWEWPAGLLALWLWKLGELDVVPEGIAEPYRLLMDGDPLAAAEIFEERGIPYERAIALSHGDTEARLLALEILEGLGATAVADKLRQELRDEGVSVPKRVRGSGQAGLTARQLEVVELLGEGLSNIEIADRLFLSPRTVEHHVAAVMSKLEASSRVEAVEHAAGAGLLTS